jgi:CBS domain containing-hemolysin-like protein
MDRQVQLHDLEDSDRYAGSFNTLAGLVIYLLKDIPETG